MLSTDPEIMKQLGATLRRWRKTRGLRVADVAEHTELNPSTVVRAEAGQNPTLLTLVRLLRCYGALGGLSQLVPEPPVSPVAAAEEERKKKPRG